MCPLKGWSVVVYVGERDVLCVVVTQAGNASCSFYFSWFKWVTISDLWFTRLLVCLSVHYMLLTVDYRLAFYVQGAPTSQYQDKFLVKPSGQSPTHERRGIGSSPPTTGDQYVWSHPYFFLKITANIVCIVRLFLASGAVNCETTYRSLASGYVSQHVLIRFLSPEIGRVVARRASGVKKITWVAWLGLLSLSSVWLLQAS